MFSDGTWDLEAPDSTVIDASRPLPVDESNGALWEMIAQDAQANNRMGEGFATLRVGLTIIDER